MKQFVIPFSGLKMGKHEFEYDVDNTFFDDFGYDEFNEADIQVLAGLNKTSTMMELDLTATGTVNVNCDVTNEPYQQEVDGALQLVIKFGAEFNDDNDEILILPHGEHQVNIAQYIYEMLVLAVPQKRVHPGVEDGTLQSEALDKLEELQPKETRSNKENTDPRWDGLKKLLTDK
ncbi:Riboflavin synthase subunit alpha [Croceitalea dokdonensis DOKDO 023]|uniref:Riboflavin synthase subunit alpha n=1 Tax=Croceitalea dokdonensis DOKDO 023 TaxID=1300341 RepID=A0A0P7AFF9_9FLAO|nr:Riboflavin synthase subunit alpha [Croceitalea dokdonensis DOKDO 023]